MVPWEVWLMPVCADQACETVSDKAGGPGARDGTPCWPHGDNWHMRQPAKALGISSPGQALRLCEAGQHPLRGGWWLQPDSLEALGVAACQQGYLQVLCLRWECHPQIVIRSCLPGQQAEKLRKRHLRAPAGRYSTGTALRLADSAG